jgi:hypothetical protein
MKIKPRLNVKSERAFSYQIRNVLFSSTHEVVEANDVSIVLSRQQLAAHMASKEPSTSCNLIVNLLKMSVFIAYQNIVSCFRVHQQWVASLQNQSAFARAKNVRMGNHGLQIENRSTSLVA